jgi:hypothetical protein
VPETTLVSWSHLAPLASSPDRRGFLCSAWLEGPSSESMRAGVNYRLTRAGLDFSSSRGCHARCWTPTGVSSLTSRPLAEGGFLLCSLCACTKARRGAGPQRTDSVTADPHSDRGRRRRILPCSQGGHGASSCERPGITTGTLARAISGIVRNFVCGSGMMGGKEPNHAETQRTAYSGCHPGPAVG